MEDKKPLTMQEIISRLSDINKEELNERQFFQEVLTVIKDMKDFELTQEEFEEFSTTLKEIGCVDAKKWMEDKKILGFEMETKPNEKGIEAGLLSTGEMYIDQYLHDYSRAKFALGLMTSGGEKSGWVQRWLKNSQKVLVGGKNNSDLEFEFYEAELSKEKAYDRKKEESELESSQVEKALLKAEIEDIDRQLEELREKEAKLKETLAEKESQLKGLEEK